MATKALKIDGMSCGHCVKAVTMALQDLPGVDVTDVKVGQATIDADDSSRDPGPTRAGHRGRGLHARRDVARVAGRPATDRRTKSGGYDGVRSAATNHG